jgi:hypothetical protein
VRQFFSGLYAAHADEDDLAAHAQVRLARMIAEDHASFALFFCERAYEEVWGDLYLCRAKARGKFSQALAVENRAALDADDLVLFYRFDGEESLCRESDSL